MPFRGLALEATSWHFSGTLLSSVPLGRSQIHTVGNRLLVRAILMTTSMTLEQQLAETLSKLETALLSPVIAGEFSQWVHAVQEAAATLTVDLTSFLHSVLHVQYKEISKADLEMATQVEKLMAGDRHLLEQLRRFHEDL